MNDVVVRVRVGAEDYALPVENVLEVAELGSLTPVPGAASAVLGVRNLRGQVIPVLDLAGFFEIESAGEPTRLVVAEHGERRAGLAVDALVDVGPLPEEASETADSPYLTGAAVVDGTLVGLVDVGSLLTALEGRS